MPAANPQIMPSHSSPIIVSGARSVRAIAPDAHASGPTIFVVDDDASVRAALDSLLAASGHQVRLFAHAADFLAAPLPLGPACVILDMHMPSMDGLDVVAELARINAGLPVIILTGYWMYGGLIFAIIGVAAWLGANRLSGYGAAVLSQVALFIARKIWLMIRARQSKRVNT